MYYVFTYLFFFICSFIHLFIYIYTCLQRFGVARSLATGRASFSSSKKRGRCSCCCWSAACAPKRPGWGPFREITLETWELTKQIAE